MRKPISIVSLSFALLLFANLGAGADPNADLVRAVRAMNVPGLRAALAAKADPNTLVSAYRTTSIDDTKFEISGPPIFAVLSWHPIGYGLIDALKLLKSAGADFHARSSVGESIIVESFATAYYHQPGEELEILKALLELGADPRQPSDYSYTLNGKPAKGSLSPLLAAERYGYDREKEFAAFVPILIAAGADPRPRWPWGKTALAEMFSGYEPRMKPIVTAYLDAGVDPSPDELTELGKALVSRKFGDDLGIVDRVLAASTNINAPDKNGDPFLYALVFDYGLRAPPPDRMKVLDLAKARGADFSQSSSNGETPLAAALSSPDLDLFDALVARGSDPTRRDSRGKTLLFFLPKSLDLKVVSGLIDRFQAMGLDINSRDKTGTTAFFYDVSPDASVDFLKLLVSKGADPSIPDMDGLTAYGYARDEGFRAAMSYLEALKVPASVGGWPVGNKSPACKAVLAGDLAAIAALPASAFSEKAARTSDGVPSTALHLAAESGNAKVIAALAARKVDWDAADRYGRRPLELAVLAGKAEAVRALMAAGADPNALDDNGETPLSRAVAARSPLARLMLDAGAKPDWSSLSLAAVVSSTPEEAARLSGGNWGTDSVDAITDFGRPDLLAAFGSTVKHETKGLPELIKDSKESVAAFEAYEKKAAEPSAGKALPADQRERKGSYTLTLDSWSPWMDVDPGLDLKKYPVEVYVPKEYDGSKPYGLVISMLNAKGSSQQPKSEYLASLSSRRLIYVGFDPYNRVFEDGTNDDYRFTNHERFILAILYRMLGAYGLDRSRIYLAGFSWGGRLTGEIVPKWPLLFSGGIAVGGCFTSGNRIVPSYRLARERATMVCVSKDWDYNRGETRNGYNVFAALGYEAYYLQEPMRGHSRISGEYLERALGLLDAAAARRAAAKK